MSFQWIVESAPPFDALSRSGCGAGDGNRTRVLSLGSRSRVNPLVDDLPNQRGIVGCGLAPHSALGNARATEHQSLVAKSCRSSPIIQSTRTGLWTHGGSRSNKGGRTTPKGRETRLFHTLGKRREGGKGVCQRRSLQSTGGLSPGLECVRWLHLGGPRGGQIDRLGHRRGIGSRRRGIGRCCGSCPGAHD